jgi:hypothetical protein
MKESGQPASIKPTESWLPVRVGSQRCTKLATVLAQVKGWVLAMLSLYGMRVGSAPGLRPPLTSHCGRRPACCQVGSEGMVAPTGLTRGMRVSFR